MSEMKELLLKLAFLTSNSNLRRLQLDELNRKRQNLRRMIILAGQKMMELYTASILTRTRRIWTLERHGRFWENDVPKMSDVVFKNNFRMTRRSFGILCGKLGVLTRQDNNFRTCIPLGKRVGVALIALRSPAEFNSVGRIFGVSKTSVWRLLHEFCIQVSKVLGPEYLSNDIFTQEKITECVNGFTAFGLPQCFGAMDARHIEVRPAALEAVDYRNSKGWYSMVLFALVDYRYRFLYINVGSPGSYNKSTVFDSSKLKSRLEKQKIFNENATMINGISVPVVVLADSAFRLNTYTMTPYLPGIIIDPQEELFNYFLSKATRVVEDAFEHVKARFRRIGKGIYNNTRNAIPIVKCCCVLHNFLIEQNDHINEKWLLLQRSFEEAKLMEPPEDIIENADNNIEAEIIRNALSTHLLSQHSESEYWEGVSEEHNEENIILDVKYL